SNPDKLAEMTALLTKINDEQSKPLWPSLLEGSVPIDRPLDTPEVEGEEYVYWPN
ncbi:MAG: sulfatase, partial [Alphaproteobacteria bacterium]|nr:sulfatase [Alphaproteobacteria bacterium]